MAAAMGRDGAEALALVRREMFDLPVLDVGMPEMDGLALCRQIRRGSALPILFLSTRDEEVDRVLGLKIGVDDDLTEPFSPRELVARIRAIEAQPPAARRRRRAPPRPPRPSLPRRLLDDAWWLAAALGDRPALAPPSPSRPACSPPPWPTILPGWSPQSTGEPQSPSLRAVDRPESQITKVVQMLRFLIFVIALLTAWFPARADDAFDADSLVFQNVFCHRVGDRTSYSVVGTGAFRAPRTDDVETFIVSWLNRHPHATARIVERSRLGPKLGDMDYIWIERGGDSLNVDLVRGGIVPGGMMTDGVEYLTSIESTTPVDRDSPDFPKRVVSDDVYRSFMTRVVAAEMAARTDKVGLWSDRYRSMMEEEGYMP